MTRQQAKRGAFGLAVLIAGILVGRASTRPPVLLKVEFVKADRAVVQPMLPVQLGVVVIAGPPLPAGERPVLRCEPPTERTLGVKVELQNEKREVAQIVLKCGDRTIAVDGLEFSQ